MWRMARKIKVLIRQQACNVYLNFQVQKCFQTLVILKGYSTPKWNEDFIIYSPSCHCKLVWLSTFLRTQNRFLRTLLPKPNKLLHAHFSKYRLLCSTEKSHMRVNKWRQFIFAVNYPLAAVSLFHFCEIRVTVCTATDVDILKTCEKQKWLTKFPIRFSRLGTLSCPDREK